jgi:hypothetical protein
VTGGGVFANRRFTTYTAPPPVLGHLALLEEQNSWLFLLLLFVLGGISCQLSCALNKRSPRGFPLGGSARRRTNLPRTNPDKKHKKPLLERW